MDEEEVADFERFAGIAMEEHERCGGGGGGVNVSEGDVAEMKEQITVMKHLLSEQAKNHKEAMSQLVMMIKKLLESVDAMQSHVKHLRQGHEMHEHRLATLENPNPTGNRQQQQSHHAVVGGGGTQTRQEQAKAEADKKLEEQQQRKKRPKKT
jgi:hypothetical protein